MVETFTIGDMLLIPDSVQQCIHPKVYDFISSWSIPPSILSRSPNFAAKIGQTHIPLFEAFDYLVWEGTDSGTLSLKEAFLHLKPVHSSFSWGKLTWNSSIPPSRSFIAWRLLHKIMPTDENLRSSSCITVSVCNLYHQSDESSDHLFLHCNFAGKIWLRFSSILKTAMDLSSIELTFYVYSRNWSAQIKDVVLACIINSLSSIWNCRNKARFDNKFIHIRSAIGMIIASTSFSGNHSKGCMSTSIEEFSILKSLAINGHPNKAPSEPVQYMLRPKAKVDLFH